MNITIVVPVYKQAQYLQRCLASIEWQMEASDRLVVVDDGNQPPVELPENWVIRNENNLGVSYSRNQGVAQSASSKVAESEQWIKFLDADDILAPFALANFRKLKINESFNVVAGVFTQVVDGKIGGSGTAEFASIRAKNPCLLSSAFIRRRAFEVVGGFDERIQFEEDWDLWLKLEREFGISSFATIGQLVCYYWISEA